MLPEDLRHQLIQEFDLVVFVDLADVWQKHRAIFDLFKLAKKSAFAPQERLVFYSTNELEQDFLDHIQRAAARIDISNWFILIVSPLDIKYKLNQSNKKFGYDDVVIQSLIRTLENTKNFGIKGFFDIDRICPLPFVEMDVTPRGQVKPCCKFKKSVGDVNTETLLDIFKGPKFQSIRDQMIAGTKLEDCSVCWQNEETGTTSYRQLAIIRYRDHLDQGWAEDPQIRGLNWSPMSLCNFTCRICSSYASTSIAAEQIKFSNESDEKSRLKLLIKNSNDNARNDNIIESLGAFTDLQMIHLMGGEPLLWPKFPNLIDNLVSNQLCQGTAIEFSTNGSSFPDNLINRVIENFRSVTILLSIDNVGQRFEIERGGNWQTVKSNVEKFAALKSDKVKINFVTSVNLQNVLYLDDVADFANQFDIDIIWWYVEDPIFLSIDRATPQTKNLVANRYLGHQVKELHNIAVRMLASDGSDGQAFLEYCQVIDRRRGQNFAESHSEIFKSMGGCV